MHRIVIAYHFNLIYYLSNMKKSIGICQSIGQILGIASSLVFNFILKARWTKTNDHWPPHQEGIESPSNPALRDVSARCLHEFLVWSRKQCTVSNECYTLNKTTNAYRTTWFFRQPIYSPYHGYNYSYLMLTNFIGSCYMSDFFFLQKWYLYIGLYMSCIVGVVCVLLIRVYLPRANVFSNSS